MFFVNLEVPFAPDDIAVALEGRTIPAGTTKMKLGIRPEHIQLVAANGDLAAGIETVENLGESHLVYLRTSSGGQIVVRGDGEANVKRGEKVLAAFAKSEISLFGMDGKAFGRR